MAKHKVSELEGRALDAAVALARGWTTDGVWCDDPERPNDSIKLGEPGDWAEGGEYFAPSTRWQDGGPIIEQERINVAYDDQGGSERGMWGAYRYDGDGTMYFAEAPLIAAMRAYVASKFGEEVELP